MPIRLVVRLVSGLVVPFFLASRYSELHFAVIGEIYNNNGNTRGQIWVRLGKGRPREDSAEADLYRLLFRDLSTGGVVRQHCQTDYAGNFIKKQKQPRRNAPVGQRMKSAFDDEEGYELTALGQQFVHYAMSEITAKLEYREDTTAGGDVAGSELAAHGQDE